MSNEVAARLLEQIAQDLSSPDVIFPTSFELTLRVQSLLKKQDTTVDQIAKLIESEPLMSVKIMAYANSAAMRRSGQEISDVATAILRIGFDAVRTVSFSLSVEQLIRSKHMQRFHQLSSDIWEHSVAVAAVARLLARAHRMNAEKAFFMGMVHDIGAFYLLFRLSQDENISADPASLLDLIFQWHDGIGHALLSAMDQPEELINAVQDHEAPVVLTSLNSWTALLTCADTLGHRLHDWAPRGDDTANGRIIAPELLDQAAQDALLEQAREDMDALRANLF